MPIMFYSYKFLFKRNSVFYNISSFYIVIIVSQLLFFNLIKLNIINNLIVILSCVGIFIILICYFLFRALITNKFGFRAHSEEYNIF